MSVQDFNKLVDDQFEIWRQTADKINKAAMDFHKERCDIKDKVDDCEDKFMHLFIRRLQDKIMDEIRTERAHSPFVTKDDAV